MTTHNGMQHGPQIRSFARMGAVAVVAASLVAACGGSSKPAGTGSGTGSTSGGDTITIKDFKYNQLTVKAGAKVTVVNNDSAPHTVTDSSSNGFDTGTLQGGSSGSFTAPTTPGSYDFICSIHNYMKGTLVVTS